jgi:NAD(P)H dehydrogenase (quinone)
MDGTWRDKVAAGFTNSGSKSGDKMSTLISLAVFAAQHHMHWVNLGLSPGWNSSAGSEQDLNRLGFWLGAGAATDVDATPEQVHAADLATCLHLGRRVAEVSLQLVAGRAATAGAPDPATASAPAR